MTSADLAPKVIRDYYTEEYYEGERNLSERRWETTNRLLSLDVGSNVLDLGAGTGENASVLKDNGLAVTCVDFGIYGISGCVKKGLDGVVADGRFLPFIDGAFDGLCSTSFLEHIPRNDVNRVLTEAQRVVRLRGRLVLHTEPNKILEQLSIFYGLLNKRHWRRYYDSGGHVNTYTPSRFIQDIVHANIHVSSFLMDGYPREAPFARVLAPLSRLRPLVRFLGNEMWAVATNVRNEKPLPFVSVIVPVKNERQTIEHCLTSLTSLTYRDYEIIVVDGGSSDGTREFIETVSEKTPRIRMLVNKGNPSSARNVALDQAKGEVIAFTDGDCFVPPEWLSSLVNALMQSRPEVVGVGGPNVPVATNPNSWSTVIPHVLNSFPGSAKSTQVSTPRDGYVRALSTSNSVYWARSICAVGGFDSRLDYCEDSDLSAKLLQHGFKLRFASGSKVYHARNYDSPLQFGRHMFQYGRGRGEALATKPSTVASRTSLTTILLFTTFLSLLAFALLGNDVSRTLLILLLVGYLLVIGFSSVVYSGGGFRALLTAMMSYLIMHIAYATGLITGIILNLPRLIGERRFN